MHPLITAHINLARIEKSLRRVTTRLHFAQLVGAAQKNWDLIDEVMTSCQSPKILVGFYQQSGDPYQIHYYWDNTSLFTGDSI